METFLGIFFVAGGLSYIPVLLAILTDKPVTKFTIATAFLYTSLTLILKGLSLLGW